MTCRTHKEAQMVVLMVFMVSLINIHLVKLMVIVEVLHVSFTQQKQVKKKETLGLYDFEDDVVTDGRTKPILIMRLIVVKLKEKTYIQPVKPIDLMRYLVRLVTPKNGICLDPYLGSGTTAIACEMEKFSWIGIELMPEYAEIAKARIGAVKDYEATLDTKTIIKESIKEDEEKELGIMNIFDFLD